jgi:hypothetical protein
MKVKIHTYPDGPAIGLPHDEIVSAMGLRGLAVTHNYLL